ncbi:MAG: BrxE family protein [Candidatus Binatia bacterium]
MPVEPEKSAKLIDQLALLRLLVGYLGQRKQSGWWDCDFLGPLGFRFLETIFARTARAAAVQSTSEAACTVHDRALGRVGNYHLFRLPPGLEDRLQQAIEKLDWNESTKLIESPDMAMETLQRLADAMVKAPEGPVQVGVERRILTSTSIHELAAHYHSAFREGIRCFPYFAPEKHAR